MPTGAGLQRAATGPADAGAGTPCPPESQPEPAPVALRPIPFSARARRLVLLGGAALLIALLIRLGGILTPFLWAIVVAYAFNPLVGLIQRRLGMPRLAVIGLLYLLVLGSVASILTTAVPRLNEQVTQFSRDLPNLLSDWQARYFGTHAQPFVIAGFTIDITQSARQVVAGINAALANLFGGAFTVFSSTIERITQLFLFLIVTFYLLLDAPKIGPWFGRGIPGRYRAEVVTVAREVDACLSHYLRAQLLLIAIMSTASIIVLTVMGVRFAIALAPIVGILEIFPIIGPFAAITLVTVVATFSSPNFGLTHTTSALIVALTFFVLRQIEDYAVIPNVVGHAVRLHPALILFAVASGATLGGALGLFVAVPLSGALKVLGTYLYRKLDLR